MSGAVILEAFLSCQDSFHQMLAEILKRDQRRKEMMFYPSELLNPNGDDENSWQNFIYLNDIFNAKMECRAAEVVESFLTELSHHGFESISATENFQSAVGLSKEDFAALYSHLENRLNTVFCHSKCNNLKCDKGGERRSFADNRFRLFTVLYRLKTGSSFRTMEVIFGWSKSALREWFGIIIAIMDEELQIFHEGILDGFCNKNWQLTQAIGWLKNHEEKGNHAIISERICQHNRGKREIIMSNSDGQIYGSIGAVDCTYTIRPRVGRKTFESCGLKFSRDISNFPRFDHQNPRSKVSFPFLTSFIYISFICQVVKKVVGWRMNDEFVFNCELFLPFASQLFLPTFLRCIPNCLNSGIIHRNFCTVPICAVTIVKFYSFQQYLIH